MISDLGGEKKISVEGSSAAQLEEASEETKSIIS